MRYHAHVARKKDFLDELIDEGARRDPRFPKMVDAAYERRRLLRDLAARRERSGLTQKDVATRMRTSQSAVARIERGEIDAKLSTVERYAAAIGHRLEWRVKRSAS
jgi:ribosome-binding protein aMBF1 (putative translation factor)